MRGFIIRNGNRAYESIVWEIAEAAYEHRYVQIDYQKDEASAIISRRIQPIGILYSEGYFYLAAYILMGQEKKQSQGMKEAAATEEGDGRLFPAVYRLDCVVNYKILEERFRVSYGERFEESELGKEYGFDINIPYPIAGSMDVSYMWEFIRDCHAKELFTKLEQIKEMEPWRITSSLWFVNDCSNTQCRVYNGKTRNIEYFGNKRRARILQVIYLSDKRLVENNQVTFIVYSICDKIEFNRLCVLFSKLLSATCNCF